MCLAHEGAAVEYLAYFATNEGTKALKASCLHDIIEFRVRTALQAWNIYMLSPSLETVLDNTPGLLAKARKQIQGHHLVAQNDSC
eukprot:scaffold255701_cov17-Prasinocladus_malaysianus.AAC.2